MDMNSILYRYFFAAGAVLQLFGVSVYVIMKWEEIKLIHEVLPVTVPAFLGLLIMEVNITKLINCLLKLNCLGGDVHLTKCID